MIIEIKAKFPIEWDREYYLVGSKEKSVFAPCVACNSKGKVEIKGELYKCPRCFGNYREKEVISKITVYHVDKYKLSRIEVNRGSYTESYASGIALRFEQSSNSKGYPNNIIIRQRDFKTMKIDAHISERYLINDYKEALRQVKAANAVEKAKETEVKHE